MELSYHYYFSLQEWTISAYNDINILLVNTESVACMYSPIQKDKRACNTVPESKSNESNINAIIKNSRALIL